VTSPSCYQFLTIAAALAGSLPRAVLEHAELDSLAI
jgi:hypothetical protein